MQDFRWQADVLLLQGGVSVLGLKTVLAVLTGARLRDRLAFLFREHSDHQVSKSQKLVDILRFALIPIPSSPKTVNSCSCI